MLRPQPPPMPPVSLERRSEPVQARSNATVERILAAAAQLLEEVGFEGLSTNAICRQAGMTPPALYRYFPNKHAVLRALGERLMERQNAVLLAWLQQSAPGPDLAAPLQTLLRQTLEITRAEPAGAWIMRCLHASPSLCQIRVASHRQVCAALAEWAARTWPGARSASLQIPLRVAVETGYAAIEMLCDEPALDADEVLAHTAHMLALALQDAIAAP